MAVKKVWLGSTGPFLFDDAVPYIDPDGTMFPDNQNAIATDGQLLVNEPATSPTHVVRKADLDATVGNIDALVARVAALEAKFSAVSFTMAYEGFATGGVTRSTFYRKIDRLIILYLPAVSDVVTQTYIRLGNIPPEILPAISIQAPVMTNIPTVGLDWGSLTLTGDSYWKFALQPFIRSAGFVVGQNGGMPAQQISYTLD